MVPRTTTTHMAVPVWAESALPNYPSTANAQDTPPPSGVDLFRCGRCIDAVRSPHSVESDAIHGYIARLQRSGRRSTERVHQTVQGNRRGNCDGRDVS